MTFRDCFAPAKLPTIDVAVKAIVASTIVPSIIVARTIAAGLF